MQQHALDVFSEDESACLAVDEMIDYVNNNLTAEQCRTFESHTDQCRLCSEAVEGVRVYPDKEELRGFADSTKNFSSLHNAWLNFLAQNWQGAYALAAVLLIGLASIIYLNVKEQPYEAMFAEYYAPYPGAIPLVRSAPIEGKPAEAFEEYEAENFAGALKVFQEILAVEPGNTMAHFYAGVSCLALKDTSPAIMHLQNVLQDGSNELADPAAWYVGLAYLQKNDLPKTKSILNRIILDNGAYKEKAVSLLERLNR
jgi:hypothetical protein